MIIKKHTIFFILIALLSFLSGAARAANCSAIIAEIGNKINSTSDTHKLIQSPWVNIDWLKSHLGNIEPTTEHNHNYQYKWHCDSNNYLIVETDNSNKLLHLNGEYNTDQGAGIFELTPISIQQIPTPTTNDNTTHNIQALNQSKQEPSEPTFLTIDPIEISAGDTTASILSDLPQYNKHYSTNIQTFDQLLTDVKSRVQKYSDNIRVCAEGTYEYPMIVIDAIVYTTAHITKSSSGGCLIDTTVSLGELGNTNTTCDVKLNDLPQFADDTLKAAYIDPNDVDQAQSSGIIDAACKTSKSGLLEKFDHSGNTPK